MLYCDVGNHIWIRKLKYNVGRKPNNCPKHNFKECKVKGCINNGHERSLFCRKHLSENKMKKRRTDNYTLECCYKGCDRKRYMLSMYCFEHDRLKAKERSTKFRNIKKYGMSSDDAEFLIDKQNNLCAICFKPEKSKLNNKVKELCIDHCHSTGIVRGLLCVRCNVALGNFMDDISILKSAIKYLENSARE